MKLHIIGLSLLVIAGCATHQNDAYQAKQQSVIALNQANSALVNSGQMKRSDYYIAFYDALSAPPVGPLDVPAMKNAAHMIDVAKALEAGSITMDQYKSEQRAVQISMQEASQQIQGQLAQQQEARKQAALATFLQTRPRTTNCTGTAYSATCTSY